MFESVLVADRGEIASRVIRTVRSMGLKAVAVYSEADEDLPFAAEADESILLGAATPFDGYLDIDALMEAAERTNAQAVHPGCGLLAESAEFARRVTDEGLVWVGPAPEILSGMGDKAAVRALIGQAGVPVAPGPSGPLPDTEAAVRAAERVGFPVLVRASDGGDVWGDGDGAIPAHDEAGLRTAFAAARGFAERSGAPGGVLLERLVQGARHVEVQILGGPDGLVSALGERDCSVRWRGRRLIEETPSPGVGPWLRERLLAAAVRAGEAAGYRGAGTVGFVVDPAAQDFGFLELAPRLSAGHALTELVTGIDLVERQLLIAAGQAASTAGVEPAGHAIGFHVRAEDPSRGVPGHSEIEVWEEPVGEGIRIDAGYAEGNTVTPLYDPLLAELCVAGTDRPTVLARARAAIEAFRIDGPRVNLPLFAEIVHHPGFVDGDYDTGLMGLLASRC